MDTQTLAEKLVANILDNDEDGAKEAFAMLVGDLSDHNPNLAVWRALNMGEAIRKVWKERREAAERSRPPFGTASIGSKCPPVTFSVDALDTIIGRRS